MVLLKVTEGKCRMDGLICFNNARNEKGFGFLNQGFSNFLFEAPLVRKLNFHLPPIKLVEY